MTVRTRIARSLTHNLLAALVVGSGFYAVAVTHPAEQAVRPSGTIECWNPWTTQITVVVGDTCPTPERM